MTPSLSLRAEGEAISLLPRPESRCEAAGLLRRPELVERAPPKKQQYHCSKDVGAVPRTAQQARSGIGPYELEAFSFIDNPAYGRGQWLAMTGNSGLQ